MANSYLVMSQCKSPLEYIALRTIQIAIKDLVNAYTKANKYVADIKAGIETKKNKKRLEKITNNISEIEGYFLKDPNGIFEELGVDGSTLYYNVRDDFKLVLAGLDYSEEVPRCNQTYELVEVDGQYTFVFL